MSSNTPTPVSFDALSVGRSSTSPFITVFETRNPTTVDVNYPIQQRWYNTSQETEWILTAYSVVSGTKTAIWQPIGQLSGATETLTGNSGGAVSVDVNNNINVVGDATSIEIVGNPSTHTLTASLIAPVSIANGGTNATSFSTPTGIVYYNGTRLISSSTATINASNVFTNSAQPLFIAHKSTFNSDATGDGTIFTPIYDITVVDQASNYNNSTGAFTAPQAGNYIFQFYTYVQSISSSHTTGLFFLSVNGSGSIYLYGANFYAIAANGSPNFIYAGGSTMLLLNANDVVTPSIQVSNGTKTITVGGGDFSGWLVY